MPTVQELLASVDAARDEIVRLHQELVRIPTVNYGSRPDTGNETPAVESTRQAWSINEPGWVAAAMPRGTATIIERV